MITGHVRNYCRRLLWRRAGEVDQEDLKKSAIIFAPHQDDETLGCGGTILKKRAVEAHVSLVFMTDGVTSHNHLMPAEDLKKQRQIEALAAGDELGIEDEDILFLNFRDSQLSEDKDKATAQVVDILNHRQPEEIFIPYYRDPQLDHIATNQIVKMALSQTKFTATIYEYPVWFWYHWPWVNIKQSTLRSSLAVIKKTALVSLFGFFLIKDFRVKVSTQPVQTKKMEALNHHHSQMTLLIDDPRWLTLHDVANGKFLDCFFQGFELFHRYHIPSRR